MKIAAIIDEFNNISLKHNDLITRVRQQTQADYVIAAMSSDFLQQGLPASESKYVRASKAIDAGVDLVIEIPVYASLQSPDTYAFAAVALLERLGCVDELAIICNTDQTELIQKISMFLFMEPMSFQSTIRDLRAKGISFYDARAISMESHIPGSKNVLDFPKNTFATEYGRAMKRMYSTMKPHYISTEFMDSNLCVSTRAAVSQALASNLTQSFELPESRLNEIFGGTSMLVDNISIEKENAFDFLSIAKSLSTATRSEANIRRYLLSLLIGIRKQDIAIARLYSFSIYARIIGCGLQAQPLVDYICNKAWMPVFIDLADVSANETLSIPSDILNNTKYIQEPEDASKQMLLKLDRKAHQLYLSIHGN